MKTSLQTILSRIKAALFKKLCRGAVRIAPGVALRGSAAVMALFALFGFNPQALAATDTWIGNTSANFADSNWASGGNNPPQSDDSLVFGAAGSSGLTLTDNLLTSAFTIDGITFNVGASAFVIDPGTPGTNGFTLGSGDAITNNSANTETINDLIDLTGTDTFTTDTTGGGLTFGGVIGGTHDGVLVNGVGTVTLDDAAVNTYTGGTTINGGTLVENYTFAGSPTSNLINSSSALSLGGGTFEINGNASTTNSQTFASTTFVSGNSTIEAISGASGTANVTLGALTHDAGSDVLFVEPTTGSIGTGISTTAALLGYGVVDTGGPMTLPE